MRVSFSFGGGPHKNRDTRHHRHHHGVSVGITLGPMGSAIMCLIFVLIGIYITFISFGNFIFLIIGIIFVVVGAGGFVNNIRKLKHSKDN